MTQYRLRPAVDTSTGDRRLDRDDTILWFLVAACGAIRVGVAVSTGETFGAEATIALFMLVVGIIALIANARGRRA